MNDWPEWQEPEIRIETPFQKNLMEVLICVASGAAWGLIIHVLFAPIIMIFFHRYIIRPMRGEFILAQGYFLSRLFSSYALFGLICAAYPLLYFCANILRFGPWLCSILGGIVFPLTIWPFYAWFQIDMSTDYYLNSIIGMIAGFAMAQNRKNFEYKIG